MSFHENNRSGGTTNHDEEIKAFRDHAEGIIRTYPDVNACPAEKRLESVVCMTAAALLEVHDASGISLDDWTGPYQCVVEALFIVGLDRTRFLANGV